METFNPQALPGNPACYIVEQHPRLMGKVAARAAADRKGRSLKGNMIRDY